MIRVKQFNATGVAPNGRLYAGDLLAIQDAAAGLSDFTQTIDLSTLRIGDTGIQLLKHGTLDARITAALRADGIMRGLGGIFAGTFTTAQRDAIPAGSRPYGLEIMNTTNNRREINLGTDAVPNWSPVGGSQTLYGTLASRPAANSVFAGTKYFATDQVVEYLSDGVNWIRTGTPAGATMAWFSAVAPAGWVKYDGANLPSSTGIYADLATHLGGVATPNTKGKVVVGQDTADTDFDSIGEIRGAKTHQLTIAEMPSHQHGGGVHNHTAQSDRAGVHFPASPAYAGMTGSSGHGIAQNITVNNSGTIIAPEGGGGSHNNIQPSIVGLYIAKL